MESGDFVLIIILNKATVPNMFLMSMVNELLEELHGMLVFSKLDFKLRYIKFKCIYMIYLKWLSKHTRSIINLWSYLSSNQMCHEVHIWALFVLFHLSIF